MFKFKLIMVNLLHCANEYHWGSDWWLFFIQFTTLGTKTPKIFLTFNADCQVFYNTNKLCLPNIYQLLFLLDLVGATSVAQAKKQPTSARRRFPSQFDKPRLADIARTKHYCPLVCQTMHVLPLGGALSG